MEHEDLQPITKDYCWYLLIAHYSKGS